MRVFWTILVVALGFAGWAYVGRNGSTPPFRDDKGGIVAGSVADMQKINLGGVEQSVIIRGRDARAPVLIWLHGGPGTDETGIWRQRNAALEDHFVVVYWAQRGAGQSFHSDIPKASMNLTQFVADLDQLVGVLQTRFHQPKVALVGHSWGTNIGVAYSLAHPEKVSAYIGIGQIANSAEGERRSYAFTRAQAEQRGDADAIAALKAMGPPPYALPSIMEERKWLEKFGGGSFHIETPLWKLLWEAFQNDEITWRDGIGFVRGAPFSLEALAPEVARFDWISTATRFEMPIFIGAGRFDNNTDASLAHDYFNRIEAPYKQFKWFENSAHSPMFEEPAAFNAFMIDDVLPRVRLSLVPPARVQSPSNQSKSHV